VELTRYDRRSKFIVRAVALLMTFTSLQFVLFVPKLLNVLDELKNPVLYRRRATGNSPSGAALSLSIGTSVPLAPLTSQSSGAESPGIAATRLSSAVSTLREVNTFLSSARNKLSDVGINTNSVDATALSDSLLKSRAATEKVAATVIELHNEMLSLNARVLQTTADCDERITTAPPAPVIDTPPLSSSLTASLPAV